MDATLVLTHDCNLGCSYCYTGRKFRKVMPDDIAEKGLQFAFSDVAEVVVEQVAGDSAELAAAIATLEAEGGTNIYAGLRSAYELTDAYAMDG